MANLKSLAAPLKQTFSQYGLTLTPAQEHVAQEMQDQGAIDWSTVLSKLGKFAAAVIPILIAIFAGDNPAPTPAPVQGAAPVGHHCDHHACCNECLKAALKTVECIARHCCECCAYG